MSDIPEAAIQAAAEAWEEHYEGPAICGSIDECSEHAARAGIEAAMPAIEEALREQITDREAAAAAKALRDAADRIIPGDHSCFKPWCPQCAQRQTREWIQTDLHNAAARLTPDTEGETDE